MMNDPQMNADGGRIPPRHEMVVCTLRPSGEALGLKQGQRLTVEQFNHREVQGWIAAHSQTQKTKE